MTKRKKKQKIYSFSFASRFAFHLNDEFTFDVILQVQRKIHRQQFTSHQNQRPILYHPVRHGQLIRTSINTHRQNRTHPRMSRTVRFSPSVRVKVNHRFTRQALVQFLAMILMILATMA